MTFDPILIILCSSPVLPDANIIWLFRSAIGGKKEYAKIEDETAMVDAKLFVCSNASGKSDYHFIKTNSSNPK